MVEVRAGGGLGDYVHPGGSLRRESELPLWPGAGHSL